MGANIYKHPLMPGTVQVIYANCLILSSKNKTSQWGKHHSSYFADEKTGAPRVSETCSRLHSQKSAEPGGGPTASLARHVCFITGQVVLLRPQAAPLWHGESPGGTLRPGIMV